MIVSTLQQHTHYQDQTEVSTSMKDINISVIIPVYNGETHLRECLESVLSQTEPVQEIIIVNDGSTDNTLSIIREYESIQGVKCISQENKGLSEARNNGIRASSGNHIAFIDADDIWLPEKIQFQRQILEKHNNIGVVHSNIACIDEHGVPVEGIPFDSNGAHGDCIEHIMMYCGIVISSAVIPRDVLLDVGLFDDRLKSTQDYELFLRISEKYTIHHLDKVLTLYRRHSQSLSQSDHGINTFRETLSALSIFLEKANKNKRLRSISQKAKSRFYCILARKYFANGQRMKAKLFLARSFFYHQKNPDIKALFLKFPFPGFIVKQYRWYKKKYTT